MRTASIVTVLLMTVLIAQEAGLAGRWQTDRAPWVTGTDAVASPVGAERQPRTARAGEVRELVIEEQVDTVAVSQGVVRWALPTDGATVTTQDAAGNPVAARAVREGPTLVVRSTHTVRLPGGGEQTVEREVRHTRQADGTLLVETTTTTGSVTQRNRALYRRVE